MENAIRIELDDRGVIVAFDDAAAELLGDDIRKRIGDPFADLLNEGDRSRVSPDPSGGSMLVADPTIVRLVHADGHSIWVELHRGDDLDGTPSVWAAPFRRMDPGSSRAANEPDPYHALVQTSADIVMILEPEGMIRFVNTTMLRMLGMEPGDLIGSQVLDIIHPDDHDALTELVIELLADPETPRSLEFRTRHVDGTYRWIDGWLQNLLDHPDVGGFLGNGRDVSDRHRAQAALAASEERFRLLAASSPSAIFELDRDGRVCFANDRWRDVTGRAVDEASDIFEVLHPVDARRIRSMWDANGSPVSLDEDVQVIRPDGSERWVELHTRPIEGGDAVETTHVGSLHDVTDIHHAHSELEHLATHDPLTGLPNRALLRERLGLAVATAAKSGDQFALLFVDLDRFKVVNDSLGHHAGDEILMAVTARLDDLVRPQDLVARFGGDEFVVLCDPIIDPAQAVNLAERIRREVSGGVDVDGETVHVSVSVGVVIGGGDRTPEELLRDADAAMYVAKVGGRDRAQLFDEAMHRAAMDRLSVEAGLRRGLERSEFAMYYQPIVKVDTGKVWGVEALVRWNHPERGLLEPAEFLAVAEESGVLRDLGPWILERACSEAANWPVIGRPTIGSGTGPTLFVNLAAAQVASTHLLDRVGSVLATTGIDPARLILEVTEGMLLTDADQTAELLGALRALGVRVAIDDFGTGYSSLSYLSKLPVDVLKVDQSFVAGLATSAKDREVTGAIIALAHALGLTTVAEGIEHPAQLEALAELGCDLAQGFLFSKPVPASDLDTMVASLF